MGSVTNQQLPVGIINDAISNTRNAAGLRKRNRRENLAALVFLLPYLILMIMFAVFPVFYAFGLSFFDTIDYVFWGFTNYREALSDYRLLPAIRNVLSFVAVWVSLMIVGVTVLSLCLDTLKERTATIIRTVYYVPGAIASSAVVVLWLFLLEPRVSPFNFLFDLAGWETRQHTFQGLGEVGVFSLMSFIAHSGGWIVVFGGALASLPGEVLEAARIDGANRYQIATWIKLPLIYRTVILMVIFSVSTGLQIFVEPHLIGLAGDEFLRPDWSVTQLAFFYAFNFGDFGIAAAISVLSLILPLVFAFTLIFATRFYRID